jgi:hypothetical protein
MGLDFRHRRRIEGDFQQIASVAGSHEPVAGQTIQQISRPGQRLEAGIVLPGFDDLAVLPYGQLDRARADIDSCRAHGLLPSPLPVIPNAVRNPQFTIAARKGLETPRDPSLHSG